MQEGVEPVEDGEAGVGEAGVGEPRAGEVVAWHELSASQHREALARFEQLRPCLEEGVSISAQARSLQVPLKTVQRWVRRYRAVGLVGLAHHTRADRGRRRSISAECVQVIEGMAKAATRVVESDGASRSVQDRAAGTLGRTELWTGVQYCVVPLPGTGGVGAGRIKGVSRAL